MKEFMALLLAVGVDRYSSFSGTEVRLTSKNGYVLGGYIPTARDTYFRRKFLSDSNLYLRKLQRVSPTDCYGTSGENKSSLVLVTGSSGGGGGQWVLTVLPSFRIRVIGGNKSLKYIIFQYTKVARPRSTICETLGVLVLGEVLSMK